MAQGWDSKRLDTGKASAPDTPAHRSRKNRRRWCKGKVGVEHTPETRIGNWGRYMAAKSGKTEPCRWLPDSTWKYPHRVKPWWRCVHEIGCSTCGKILEPMIGKRCPDYRPRD